MFHFVTAILSYLDFHVRDITDNTFYVFSFRSRFYFRLTHVPSNLIILMWGPCFFFPTFVRLRNGTKEEKAFAILNLGKRRCHITISSLIQSFSAVGWTMDFVLSICRKAFQFFRWIRYYVRNFDTNSKNFSSK